MTLISPRCLAPHRIHANFYGATLMLLACHWFSLFMLYRASRLVCHRSTDLFGFIGFDPPQFAPPRAFLSSQWWLNNDCPAAPQHLCKNTRSLPSSIPQPPLDFAVFVFHNDHVGFGGVAQLVRVLVCHAGGRGFEPRHPRQ